MFVFQLNYSKYQAGYLSTVFEIGGVLGTAMLGFFVTRYFFTVFSQCVLKEHVTHGAEKVSFTVSCSAATVACTSLKVILISPPPHTHTHTLKTKGPRLIID